MKPSMGKSSVTGGSTEKIGKVGPTKGNTGDSGGQHSHMPPASSYSGRKGGSSSGGATLDKSQLQIPFLPSKPK